MKKFLLLFLLFPHFAFASFPSGGSYYFVQQYGTGTVLLNYVLEASTTAACADSMSHVVGSPAPVNSSFTTGPPSCNWWTGSTYYSSGYFTSRTCPMNSTGTTTCTCSSGYVQNTSAPFSCNLPVTSPNGSTAPVGPLGAAAIGLAGALALGMLGAVAALVAAPTLGTSLLAAAALASGLISAPAFYGGPGSANTAAQEFSQAGSPLSVNLAPSDAYSAGASGSSGAVGVNSGGAFVPGGGGSYTGTGATGGWGATTGGATGEWTYYETVPGSPPVPIAAISNNGFTYKAVTDASNGLPIGSVVAERYVDGSMTVTDARTVPVMESSGTFTTAEVATVNSYGPDGVRLPGGSSTTIGPTLGNGHASNGGTGLAIYGTGGGGGGTGTGSGTPTPDPCIANPTRVGCLDVGSPLGTDVLSKKTTDVSITPVTFTSSSSCPSDLSFTAAGHTYGVGYAPLCDRLAMLKYLFLVMAGFAAAYILADSFKV